MSRERFKLNETEYATQSTNLVTYLTANKTRLNITDEQIATVGGVVAPFPVALDQHKDAILEERRLAVVSETTQDASRHALGTFIDNLGDRWTNEDRAANEMPQLEGHGGPRPIPTEVPFLMVSNGAPGELRVLVLDAARPTHRGRPADVDSVDIRWEIQDDDVPTDYDEWHSGPTPSNLKTATSVRLNAKYKGQTVLLVARFHNTNGDGPWSETASAVLT